MSSAEDSDDNVEVGEKTRRLVMAHNRKKKKSGGFQAMGLSHAVYKGVTRKGYKVPTPIQRKAIPVILEGKDVVAMARTGSGKTAAFVVPMLEKLQEHSAKGARAIILSPTRELAVQTLKFTKELGKFTGLRAAVILGGDKMEEQFSALHENPDIIIATPGRFLHVLVEMNKRLTDVQYIVFDEADRLFEMGFAEQLREILHRVPESRQTLLFSATLPKSLVDFAQAGLSEPVLIRLDVETKLSPLLKMSFFACRPDEKVSMLIYLLRELSAKNEQTVVFTATKHHVEYLQMLLSRANISNTYIYSSLDQTARKIHVAQFQQKHVKVLVVTDLAARGIDIPHLDNVINYNFPAKAKLFVHRVGRVARAGRSGVAYSLIAAEELPYLVDLHVFLGREIKVVPPDGQQDDSDGYYGSIPQRLLDDMAEEMKLLHDGSVDLKNQLRVTHNAYKQYIRSRPPAATESIKRAKQIENEMVLGMHPVLNKVRDAAESERLQVLFALKAFKTRNTIFEVNTAAKKPGLAVMKEKRLMHGKIIDARRSQQKHSSARPPEQGSCSKQDVIDEDVDGVFSQVIGSSESKKDKSARGQKRKKMLQEIHVNEDRYKVTDSFSQQMNGAVLDFTGDDAQTMHNLKNIRKWDRKRKKFVGESGEGKKKIKTESGHWIPASYKRMFFLTLVTYKTWLKQQQVDEERDEMEDDNNSGNHKGGKKRGFQVMGTRGRKRYMAEAANSSQKGGKRKFKSGKLKSSDEILKERRKKAKVQAFQKQRQIINSKKQAKGKKR
ncbi:hypothetical protein C0Q70_08132 [Pomacea canaliculata]|uniref:RNA helicase n=1 Tax=Pomacea canaliculata TaxID=400727 RepID=A0A2T7PH11_POMCA|nr:hypothetical protein C0Q70_08132 [Pomacea canaliculata]